MGTGLGIIQNVPLKEAHPHQGIAALSGTVISRYFQLAPRDIQQLRQSSGNTFWNSVLFHYSIPFIRSFSVPSAIGLLFSRLIATDRLQMHIWPFKVWNNLLHTKRFLCNHISSSKGAFRTSYSLLLRLYLLLSWMWVNWQSTRLCHCPLLSLLLVNRT
jgi:hypothetical protein